MGDRAVMTWAAMDKFVYKYEYDNPAARVTRLYFDGECPDHYVGLNSECGVSHGKPALRLSTGEIIEI